MRLRIWFPGLFWLASENDLEKMAFGVVALHAVWSALQLCVLVIPVSMLLTLLTLFIRHH
jgi:hypothetical protein